MSLFQACVDYLLSVGGGYISESNELRLFYIDEKEGEFVLSYSDRTGSSFGPSKKVIGGVKKNTSAAYLSNKSKNPLILCVSASSTLLALEFDEDEDEWVDSNSFQHSDIHPSGQLTAISDEQEDLFVFFQNPGGQLIVTQGSSSLQTLPANAISSTPLTSVCINDIPVLFYISQDNLIHYLTLESGQWVDAIFSQETFKKIPKRFVASFTSKDDSGPTLNEINIFTISENNALVSITSKEKVVFGKVDPSGKFTPATTEECIIIIFCVVM